MTKPIVLKSGRTYYPPVAAELDRRWVRLLSGQAIVLLTPDQMEALIAAYRKKYP